MDSGGRITLSHLVGGVCWNDVPLQSNRLATKQGIDTIAYVNSLVPITLSDAPYLRYTHATTGAVDMSFAVQPSRGMRYAMAGAYKHFPDPLIRMCGVTHEELKEAKELLDYRTQLENTHFHFMREDAHDSSELVCRRATRQGAKWMREAIEKRDLFYVGNIWHMVQDSFSPAHCHRARPSVAGKLPWGAVVFVEWFGDQNDNSHGYLESYRATQSSNRPTKARVQLCAGPEGPLYSILRLFLVGIKERRSARDVARDCRQLLKRYVFNYRPDLACDMGKGVPPFETLPGDGAYCHGHFEGNRAEASQDPLPYAHDVDAQIMHRIDRSLLDYIVTPRISKIEYGVERPIENNRQQLDKAATIPIQSVEIRNAQFLWMLRADKQTPIEVHMQYIDVPYGNICGGQPTPSHLALQRLFDENRDTTQILLYSTDLHSKPYGGFCSTMQLQQGSGVLYLKHNVGSDDDDDEKIEVNLWLVANGWARYKDRKLWPNPLGDRYVLAEVRASKAKLGLWDDSRYPGAWKELEARRKMAEEALPPAPPLTCYQLEHPPAPM
jgi:hypothetical protein